MLVIKNLEVWYRTQIGLHKAVDKLNLEIGEGEVLALVGESGSGKSTVALAILKLLPKDSIIKGEIFFGGEDILKRDYPIKELRRDNIGIIFQDPAVSFCPTFSIKDQFIQTLKYHIEGNFLEKAKSLLKEVKLDSARTLSLYPHQLSGGMLQRVMIAQALVKKPKLLIADEPTSCLDVTTQREILFLLKELHQKYNTSILFITHDLSVAKAICNKVAVMKDGRLIEYGEKEKVFKNPHSDYTKELLRCFFAET